MNNEAGAVFFKLLGSLLYEEPSEATLNALASSGVFDEPPFETDFALIRSGCEEMRAWLASKPIDELAGDAQREHLRLLIGIGDVLAPPWASVYMDKDGLLFGEETMKIRQAFKRHGQEVKEKNRFPDDHIGLELQFLAALLEQGNREEALRFVEAHLAPWASRWNNDVQKHARISYYRALGNLTVGGLACL